MRKFIPRQIKNLYHFLRTVFAAVWFQFPAEHIKVIGITGTNGKTTTVQMVAKILEQAGYRVAVLSTINFKIGDKQWVNKTKYTTRSAWHVQKFIKRAVREDCEYVVLEVSSHALDQSRVWGVSFDVAVITNITREHLDYHLTMDKYSQAKAKLFRFLTEGKRKGARKVSVVNLEMERAEEFLFYKADERYGYFVHDGDSELNSTRLTKRVVAEKIKSNLESSQFEVDKVRFKLNLIGRFNIENALASICVGISQGVNLENCSKALKLINKIPGRMDEVENNRKIKIIIDYALTPDSMEQLGEVIQKRKEQGVKLTWVFGSCGNRDRGKRPIMGSIVAKYADKVIVTNEDPYDEDPMQIIEQVFAGVVDEDSKERRKIEGKNAFKIEDRREAIKKAIEISRKGDIVLVTGKGAEETMMVKGHQIPWNDREVIEDILIELENLDK